MAEQVLASGEGIARFSELSDTRVLVRYSGGLDGGLADQVTARLTRALERKGRLELFVDAADVASYTSEFRTKLTAWIQASRSKGLSAIHMYFRSKLVAMGVSVVNVVTSGVIRSYSDKAKFEAAYMSTQEAARTS